MKSASFKSDINKLHPVFVIHDIEYLFEIILDGKLLNMNFKALLDRQDIPEDAKAAIKKGINELRSQQFIAQNIADFEGIISQLDRNQIIQGTVDFLRTRFEFQRVSVALLDEKRNGLLVYAMTLSDSSGIFKGSFIPLENTVIAEVLKKAKPYYRPDIVSEGLKYAMDKKLAAAHVRSVFYVPLIYEGSPIGCLNIGSNLINAFSDNIRHLLILLAQRLALALQNSILHDQVKKTLQELQESEEKYRSLVFQAKDGIVIIQDGIIKYANPSLAELAETTLEEIEGKSFIEFIHPSDRSFVIERYTKRMEGEEIPSIYETKLALRDGTPLVVEVNAGIITFDGRPADLIIVRNISERKDTERALQDSEEKYRAILDNIEDGYYEVDLRGNFTFFNEKICEIFGLTAEETMGMNYKEYTDERTAKVVFQTFNTVYRTKEPTRTFNWEINRKDGTKRHVEASVSLIIDLKSNKPIGFRGIVRDITKRKRVEFELQESEERYRTLINSMNEGVWVTDLYNKTLYINSALEKMMGYTSEQMMGKTVTDFLHPDSFSFFEGITEERYERGVPSSTYELKWLRRDGSSLITRVAGTALYDDKDEVMGSFGLITDITTEKLALEALQESEERYRLLIELSPDAITLTDLEFNITAVNQEAILQNGAEKPEDLIGKNALELIIPEDRQRAIDNAQKTLSTGRIQAEYRVRRKDGTRFPVDLRASLITDDKGNPSGFIAVTRDITERKKTEDALRERAILLQRMGEGVMVEDTEGYITYVNPKAATMLGYAEQEIIGKHWRNFVVPEEHEKASVETKKRPEGIGSTYELTALAKDGSHLSVILTATPLFSKSGNFKGVLDVFTDISERVELETALRQVKLEEERYHALLSHFVNNDLQKIISHTELISLQHESGQTLDPLNIDKIIDIASRSSRTIDSVNKIYEVLQTPFTKPIESHNLNKVIKDIISELSYTNRHPVEINRVDLNVVVLGDKYLLNIFYELLFFLFHSCTERGDHKKPITIDGKQTSTYYYVNIRDYCSKPISEEISLRLSKKITEEWEAQGHYIGLALASVVMQHYGGSFKIQVINGGNEFQLFFPSRLIQPSTDFIIT